MKTAPLAASCAVAESTGHGTGLSPWLSLPVVPWLSARSSIATAPRGRVRGRGEGRGRGRGEW